MPADGFVFATADDRSLFAACLSEQAAKYC